MSKKVLPILLVTMLMLFAGSVLADNEVGIVVDGKVLTPEVPAQVINDSTMVPLRFLSNALGADVGWDDNTSTAIVRKGYSSSLAITTPVQAINDGQLKLEINGVLRKDVPVMRINDRLMVPIRFISETFGCQVDWDATTNRVVITSKPASDGPTQAQMLDLLMKANQKLMGTDSYTFSNTGNVQMLMEAQGIKLDMKIDLDQQGAFKKPDEFYFKMSTQMTGVPNANSPIPSMEMYIKGNAGYTKLPTGLWQQTEVPDFGKLLGQYDPAMFIEMMKGMDLNFSSHPYTENGRQYIVIKTDFSGEKLYDAVKGLMGDIIPGAQNDSQQVAPEVDAMMKSMTGSFAYLIDAQDLSLTKGQVEMKFAINSPDIPAPMQMAVVMNTTYSTGQVFPMPTITPDMIAPDLQPKLP